MASDIFIAHFVCDNAVVSSVAEDKFNLYSKDVSYYNDSNIETDFADFKKVHILDEGVAEKFWVTYRYAHNLFMRNKYVFWDFFRGMLLGRNGETLPISGGEENNLSEQEYLAEVASKTHPPVNELKSLFDYMLSVNTHFYVLLSLMPFEEEQDDFPSFPIYHRGNLIEGRKIVELDSETAQAHFIEQVGKWHDKIVNYKWTLDDGFPAYDSRQDPLFQTIFKIS